MSGSNTNKAAPTPVVGRQEGPKAACELLPLVYEELRRLARRRMRCEPAGQTLQATALVHEAYLRLAGDSSSRWQNAGHFFAAAAEAMRRILVDHARSRGRLKRGGGKHRTSLTSVTAGPHTDPIDVLALDDALTRLQSYDARKADIVKLRYFAGLTIEETAEALGVSAATVKADWSFARAWLRRELRKGDTHAGK